MKKEATIIAAIIAPGEPVRLQRIENTLEAKQKIVGGYIEQFPVDVYGAVGICNEEGVLRGLPFNRYNAPTENFICGTFLLVGDTAPEWSSLRRSLLPAISACFGRIEGEEVFDL